MHKDIISISGASIANCMACGRCSAACPAGQAMDIKPHQFVSRLRQGEVESLLTADSIWKCLSCFTCVERCPRDVKPARVLEATRIYLLRQKEQEGITVEDINTEPNTPQQLLVSAFRKYRK